jgi:hypothetical protein
MYLYTALNDDGPNDSEDVTHDVLDIFWDFKMVICPPSPQYDNIFDIRADSSKKTKKCHVTRVTVSGAIP